MCQSIGRNGRWRGILESEGLNKEGDLRFVIVLPLLQTCVVMKLKGAILE